MSGVSQQCWGITGNGHFPGDSRLRSPTRHAQSSSARPPLLPIIVSPASVLPPNSRLFKPAQPLKTNPSVLYAWPQTPMTSEGVILKCFRMDPKPGAERTTMEGSSCLQAIPCAVTGTTVEAAPPVPTTCVMNVLGAEARIMELRNVLELRRGQALTPYKIETWKSMLSQCNLHIKYPKLIHSLHKGF